jgi:hypothetical protein
MISPMNISFNVNYSLMSEIHLPIPMVDLGYLPKSLSFSWLVRFTILNLKITVLVRSSYLTKVDP